MSNDPEAPRNNRPPPPPYVPPPPPSSQATTTTTSSLTRTAALPSKGQKWMLKSWDLNYMGPIQINDVIPLDRFQSAYIHLTNPRSFLRTQKRDAGYYPPSFWQQNIIEIQILKEEQIKQLKARGVYTRDTEDMLRSLPDIIHIPESAWSDELGEYYLLSQAGGKKIKKHQTRKQRNKKKIYV